MGLAQDPKVQKLLRSSYQLIEQYIRRFQKRRVCIWKSPPSQLRRYGNFTYHHPSRTTI